MGSFQTRITVQNRGKTFVPTMFHKSLEVGYFGQGGVFWAGSGLQLGAVPGEGLSCELSAGKTPGNWRNEYLSPKMGSGCYAMAATEMKLTFQHNNWP